MQDRVIRNNKTVKRYFLLLLIFFITYIPIVASNDTQNNLPIELEDCLKNNWGIDQNTTAFILNKFKPLLEHANHHATVKDFINISKHLKINFSINKSVEPLPEDDGIYLAPKEHLIVFENPYIRVLWGSTKSGAREAFHTHHWKSVMVIIKPTSYRLEYANGAVETELFSIGTYKLPAGEKYACTNVGPFPDEYLRFEIKE